MTSRVGLPAIVPRVRRVRCRIVALGAWVVLLALAAPAQTSAEESNVATLEDVYGVPSAGNFQTAIGFRVLEGNSISGSAQTSFGLAVDDQVVTWREYTTVADATTCTSSTPVCATVEVASGQLYDGNGVLTITVTDPFPYRCVGNPCVPEGTNDCNHDGDHVDAGDDNDCDDNGISDVLVKAFQTSDSEWVVCNRLGSTASYRGSLPFTIGGNVAGVLFVQDLGGLNDDFTVRYADSWDGSPDGSPCRNDPDPARQGNVDAGVDLILDDRGIVSATCYRIDDTIAQPPGATSDGDGFPDTNETADLYVTVSNKNTSNVTHLLAQVSVSDPKIECLLLPLATVGALAANSSTEVGPFRFKVSGSADRTAAGLTEFDIYAASFTLNFSADQFDLGDRPQSVSVELDLDSTNPLASTTTFSEGFEAGFGNFQFMNLDTSKASNSLSNGFRCQYNDPDFINSNSYGDTECYLGFAAGQSPNNAWHPHGTIMPDGGRSYLGMQSLHYGTHTVGNPGLDTTMLSQLDAVRTKSALNLAARVCAALQSGAVRSCNSAADCTNPASACVSASPELSFKHQVSTVDNRSTGTPNGQAADRCVVQAQIVGTSTVWQKLDPYQNVYDAQGTDQFSNCLFDPVDDGNDEDDYFDPTDPNRRLGPSSTCFPEFVFSYLGDTDAPFASASIGRASDGPGLAGATGLGTWVESKFCMARFRGRSIRLRFLFTSIKASDNTTLESLFMWNPRPDDDGWYIDDVRLTQTLGALSPTTTTDAKNNGDTPCDTSCSLVGPVTLTPTPASTVPGRLVSLWAAATLTQCANGLVVHQFWKDTNANGAIDTESDVLLRDFSPNALYEDAPTTDPARYLVRARCSTVPTCTGDAAATVSVTVPSAATIFPFAPLRLECAGSPAPASCPASDKRVLTLGGGDPSGAEVIRGNLAALRANGGDFSVTVDGCIANDVSAGSATDAAIPGTLAPFYYLARRSVPNTTWTTFSLREVPGAGGTRDLDLDGPPRAVNSCPAPP